jgi:hypothetical protein
VAIHPLLHLALGVARSNAGTIARQNAIAYSRFAIGGVAAERAVLKTPLRQSLKSNAKTYGRAMAADTLGTIILGPAAGAVLAGAAAAVTHPATRAAILATRNGKLARVAKRTAQRSARTTVRKAATASKRRAGAMVTYTRAGVKRLRKNPNFGK